MIASRPESMAESDFLAILRTYNDVTERLKTSHDVLLAEVQRLHEVVQEKNRQLQQRERLAALGEMAAGVAHEIRNPLGGIGLYSSLLERDLGDRPQQRDIARRISAGVFNLESIVRDILAFAGGAEPALERANMQSVLDGALAQASAKIEAMAIELSVDPAICGVDGLFDASQIERALANLIFNAIDAAGQQGRIWLRRVSAPGHLISVAVEDDGPGVLPDIRGRIFDPFFTTKHHGTGLGLAIVHRIAEAHGGGVCVQDRPGGGARFVLSIPAAAVSSAARREYVCEAALA